MTVNIKIGNLLEAPEDFIVHQGNCVTGHAKHLALSVFQRFPFSNIYKIRTSYSQAGTLDIKGNGKDKRYVITLFGQVYPGKPKYPNGTKDGYRSRLGYFRNALEIIPSSTGAICIGTFVGQTYASLNPISIAFPFGIGCGAAGGSWYSYLDAIVEWDDKHPHIETTIYKLPK